MDKVSMSVSIVRLICEGDKKALLKVGMVLIEFGTGERKQLKSKRGAK